LYCPLVLSPVLCVSYPGDYANFLFVQEEQLQRQIRQREVQEAKRCVGVQWGGCAALLAAFPPSNLLLLVLTCLREHMEKFIAEHAQAGSNGVKDARQRKSRMKKLDRLGMEAAAENQGTRYGACLFVVIVHAYI
jgi:hypothetical protein